MTDSTNLSAEAAVDAAPTDDLNSAADMPASGAERLQLAQAVVEVPMPNPGETVTITVAAGQTIRLGFDYAAAGNGEVLENGSLVLPVNGGTVILEGFAGAATFDPPVELTNNDGTVIELGDFLVAIDVPLDVLVEAAAGGGEPGGPLPETVAPNEGAGFSPGPGPVILGVLDPEGPVDPTALQYRVPEREPFIIDLEEDDEGPDANDDGPGTNNDTECVEEALLIDGGEGGYGYDISAVTDSDAVGVNPVEGNSHFFLSAQAGIPVSAIEAFFGLAQDTLRDFQVGQETTDGGAMKTEVTVSAGDTLSFSFNFLDAESSGQLTFIDLAVVVIGDQVFKLADVNDATDPGPNGTFISFNEQTGYLTFNFVFPADGTFQIGFAVMNEDDTSVDPGLLIDDIVITGPGGDVFLDGFEAGAGNWDLLQAFEATSVSDNVLDNDFEGPNPPITITGISYVGGESADPLTVTDDGGSPIITFTANDGSDDIWVLEFNLDTGDYTFTLLAPYQHSAPGTDEAHEQFLYTITDANGNSDSATLTLCIEDDVPSVFIEGGEGNITVDETADDGDEAAVGVDLATVTVSAFDLFFVDEDFGADGPGSLTFALVVASQGADSGLVDTATGNNVFLFLEGGVVVGREGTDADDAADGEEVFTIEVSGDDVTVTQLRAVVHDDPTDPDEAGSPATIGADLVGLQVTITDDDGDTDTDTADLGEIIFFEDDGPTANISGAEGAEIRLDETNDGGDDPANPAILAQVTILAGDLFNETVDPGSDELGSKQYVLDTNQGADSGLTDTLTGEAIFLSFDANGDVIGKHGTDSGDAAANGEIVFRIHVDEATGDVTVTQFRALVHGNPADPDEAATPLSLNPGDLTLQVVVFDGDGDKAGGSMDLGSLIKFEDDGPTAVDDALVSVNENTPEIGGNVLTNDDAGSDEGAKVVSFTYDGGGSSANVPDGGSVTVVTALGGTLTVHSNGDWTYEPPANVLADTHDDFVYTMEDGDHDTATATQPIIVVDVPPQVEPPTAALAVNGDGIFKEDVPNSVHISAAVTDASDHLTTVEIQGLTWGVSPAELTALQGDPSVASASFVAGTLTINFVPGIDTFTYDLTLTPPEDTDVDLAGVTISATAADDTDPSATAGFTAAPVTLVVDAILDDFADGSQTAVPSVVESAGAQTVDLNLSLTSTNAGFPNSGAGGADTDASEVVTSVTVTLSGGTLVLDPGYAGTAVVTDNGGGNYTLSGWTDFADLQNAVDALSASLPAGFDDGTITGQLSITTQEANTPAGTVAGSGAEPDVTDNTRTDTTDFTVTVTDDGPDPQDDAVTVGDAGNTVTNLVIVFDRSGSMDEDPGVDGFATRIDLARAAVAALMNSYNTFGPVNIMIVDFAGEPVAGNAAENSGWLTGEDAVLQAIDYLAGLQPDGNTDYEAAVEEVQDAYAGAPAGADQQFVYFISDGVPTVGGDAATHELTTGPGSQTEAWESFLATNDFDTAFAVGVGTGVTVGALEEIAFPNGDPDNPILVTDEEALLTTLVETVGGTVSDNVLTNDIDFGADGPPAGGAYVTSITFGATTWTYDKALDQFTDGVTTTPGHEIDIVGDHGSLHFNFLTGAYTYEAEDVTQDETDVFSYTVVDDDGTEGTAVLTVTINDVDTSVIARDDRIITNIANGTDILIPAAALLFNDFGFDGGTLSIDSVQNAVNGAALLGGGGVTFNATDDSASFDYTATVGAGSEDDATVTVTTVAGAVITSTGDDRDILIGGDGNDTLNANAGGDVLIGGGGTDTLTGGSGADLLFGGDGADTLTGGAGGDFLDGGDDGGDADTLNGGSGNDTLVVWTNDIANGGDDSDIIILKDNLNFGSVDGGFAVDVQDDNPSQPNGGMTNHRGDILVFDGDLNFNGPNAAEVSTGRQVSGIETISMREGDGSTGDTTDVLTLQAADVIAMGTGTFDPAGVGGTYGEDDTIRVDGDSGDVLNLTGGGWVNLAANPDTPDGYTLWAHDPSGVGSNEDAYVLVQAVITVNAS